MARPGAFASGRHARAICDGCGLACNYRDLRTEPVTGFRKCRACGVDEPDRSWTALGSDPIALRFARPDRNELAGLLDLDGTGLPLVLGGSNGMLETGD